MPLLTHLCTANDLWYECHAACVEHADSQSYCYSSRLPWKFGQENENEEINRMKYMFLFILWFSSTHVARSHRGHIVQWISCFLDWCGISIAWSRLTPPWMTWIISKGMIIQNCSNLCSLARCLVNIKSFLIFEEHVFPRSSNHCSTWLWFPSRTCTKYHYWCIPFSLSYWSLTWSSFNKCPLNCICSRIVQFLFTTFLIPFLDSGAPEIRFISFFQIYTCSPALSAKEQASFYKHCLCPTIVDIMLTAASDWPL